MLTFFVITAGAMNVVDAEPLDGVDFKNGVLAYITLVMFSSPRRLRGGWLVTLGTLIADCGFSGYRHDYYQRRQLSARW